MKKVEKYNETYKLMIGGAFNDIFRSATDFSKTAEISVKKLKKYCKDEEIDFDDFLKYAQERKKKENVV